MGTAVTRAGLMFVFYFETIIAPSRIRADGDTVARLPQHTWSRLGTHGFVATWGGRQDDLSIGSVPEKAAIYRSASEC